jgi:maltose alpha-D-glucosyltransferase / alpha-amylase
MNVALAPSRVKTDAETDIDRPVTNWYKDAVIYQLHVKAFSDSTGDGVGDFQGLTQRLDYIEGLGVNAIWLLPFYPSPLRDDGYDIADYQNVHPTYGDLDAFNDFVAEAHRRSIRVLTELVINHTSDQHPWFQRARKAPKGSPDREFYVWSDTDARYAGTRVIFLDTEKSNWTWDPEANAYFWHRFYSHQPDLNFDNAAVLDEIVRVMRFWLDLGVDGLRLDAVPYLCEREGTNNENLPETHAILKRVRQEVDQYRDRMLLAEANQWPEDTRPYFGDGDECHMAFHFPLMPRMYMGLAQEDRHPITDILRQTPQIPDPCQWALFLRNHDELTLEMVTDDERDYLWRTYAMDIRARLNLGIRRRLAPLLDNDRRKIELMNALLLSMPGTPVIYYGDELGMGDNYYLGDRDGVRTPMQWSADRNGGFSRADPQRLYLPAIMDANYGYQAINVEAQQRDASSLLNWMTRMIRVRKTHAAFGRGNLEFLYPRNRKILAYIREHEGQKLLCVFNLARSAQAVELDLRAHAGAVPVELMGNSAFPPIGELPYMLTLPAYGFYWFIFETEASQPRWHVPATEVVPDFITLIASQGWQGVFGDTQRSRLEREVLPEFLLRQRWFGAKDAHFARFELKHLANLEGSESYPLTLCETLLPGGNSQRYFLPLSVRWGGEHLHAGAPLLGFTLCRLRSGARVGALLDAARDEAFIRDLVRTMGEGESFGSPQVQVEFNAGPNWPSISPEAQIRAVGTEQSNVSVIIDEQIMLKIYRRIRSGTQPELEVTRFLTEVAGFQNTPKYLGAMEEISETGDRTALAIAFAFVPNQGDAWNAIVEALDRRFQDLTLIADDMEQAGEAGEELYVFPLDLASRLGERTGELHRAFGVKTSDPAFAPEMMTKQDVELWAESVRGEADHVLDDLHRDLSSLSSETAQLASRLLGARDAIRARIDSIAKCPPIGLKTRIHGDYHLGQVMIAQDDIVIVDFEGEPTRPLAERREKSSPLRDVAGMLRSLDYAAFAAIERFASRAGKVPERILATAIAWRDRASRDFLQSYFAIVSELAAPAGYVEPGLLDLFLLQKAFYEIAYEATNRPTWLGIPVRGVLELLKDKGAPQP